LLEDDVLNKVGICYNNIQEKFSLLNPKPEDIDILDIAHAEARLCRFTGHVKICVLLNILYWLHYVVLNLHYVRYHDA
jgi:hypothetical protein